MSNAQLYDASRVRIVALIRAGDPGAPVAACPGWTAKDLISHLAGGLGDFLTRRFEVEEGDDFGERTVRERRDQSVEDALAEWQRHRATADELLASPMGGVLVAEVVSHEHDLRTALGQPGARDEPGVRAALERPLQEVDRKRREAGGAAVRLVVDGATEQVIGAGEPAATLRVSAFELLRTISGRRTKDQVRALDWSVDDATPYLPALTMFGEFRDTPLDE
ncbi:maleylpyruvate isomerase family mycothiol-dependent enzyme [Actinopolymorpha alba]|uniref:maleylpyruvate isomerase family mycothiol-dependent enzyme n=1 Tax=Actinopolymorpha alba TaxID=533267 RepID=UPI0003627DCE|nr:maleylpyruvate isomerase family mycothiol-dependent enzyme [Actinopolymorpha alba]